MDFINTSQRQQKKKLKDMLFTQKQ